MNHVEAVNLLDGLDDFLPVLAGRSVDRYVADYEMVGDTNDVNRPNVSPSAANRSGQLAECAGPTRKLNAQSQTVAGAGRTLHLVNQIPFPVPDLLDLFAETLTRDSAQASTWQLLLRRRGQGSSYLL